MWKFPWKKFKGWNSSLKTLETNVGVAIEKSSRVKIQGWKLHHILSIRGQTLNLYLSTMKIKGNSGVIWPLKKFRGYNSRSKSISEEKETVNLHFSTMKKKTQGLFRICTKSDLWKKYSGAWIQGWNETFYPYLAEIQRWKEPSGFLVPYRNLISRHRNLRWCCLLSIFTSSMFRDQTKWFWQVSQVSVQLIW